MTNIGSHDAPKKAPESTTNSPEGIKKLFTELRNNNQINTEMKALIKESLVDEKTAKYKEDLKKIYFAFYSSSEGKATEHQKKAFWEWIDPKKGNLKSLQLTNEQEVWNFLDNRLFLSEGQEIIKGSKEEQDLLKLLVEFDYYSNEYTYFATPEQFEKIKKDIGKMLSINGKPLTPEQGEIGYKNLGTGSGMTEYKFSGNLPQWTGEYADKLAQLKGNFYLRSKADKQATFFELNKDKTTFTDTSDHKYQVSTTDDHLTLNKLLAYEIGGRTALGTSGETQTKKEKPQLKKESPSFTYDKEKTKENIHQRLSQVNPEVTFDTTLDKDFFTKGFPNYMKGYNLKTELEKAFLLQNDVESDEKLAIHTRKLVLQDGTAIIDIGQNIEWDFDTDNIALNPKERKNPTKITILWKEFEVNIQVDMNTNKVDIAWDKANLEALKTHIIQGFKKNIETLNRTTFTNTEKVPSLEKTPQTWTNEKGVTEPTAQSYNATQTQVSLARGYVTPLLPASKKPPQQQIDLVLVPNTDVSQISLQDNYGWKVETVEIKGLDGKKVKSTIQVTNKEKVSGLEIKGQESNDKISEYKYLDFQGDINVVQKLKSALVTVTADNKIVYIDKESKKTFATFPVEKGDKPDTKNHTEQGYRVDVSRLKDEVKAEHFYHLFSKIPEGSGAVNQSMIRNKFDTRFTSYKSTEEWQKALEGSIIDGRFHKVSANESTLTLATEADSLPPKIKEIQQAIENYLSGVEKVYNTMKSTKNKIAGELGTDRFMVDGWNTFNLSQLENPATLKVIDGDGKEVGINFKIKSTDISLDNNQTVNLAGVERKVILNKKGELEFVPLPKNK